MSECPNKDIVYLVTPLDIVYLSKECRNALNKDIVYLVTPLIKKSSPYRQTLNKDTVSLNEKNAETTLIKMFSFSETRVETPLIRTSFPLIKSVKSVKTPLIKTMSVSQNSTFQILRIEKVGTCFERATRHYSFGLIRDFVAQIGSTKLK